MEGQFVTETATIVIIDNDSKICRILKFITDLNFSVNHNRQYEVIFIDPDK